MNRSHRLLAAAGAAAVMLVPAIAGCASASGSGSAPHKTQLKLYNDKGAWTPFFQQMGSLSKQQIGIGMTPVGYTDENTYQAFIDASFRTDVKPDLFTWTTGGRLQQIVSLGQVANTSALWKQAIAAGNLSPSLEPYYTVNGQQYCVPLNVSYWGMFYNKHVFGKYGLTPPTTWAQFLNVAQTLKSHGVTPFYETSTLFTFVWFEQLLAGSDPALYNDLSTGKASYTSPGVVSVMKQWQSFINDGYMSSPGVTTDPSVMLQQGQVAMVPDGSWFNTSMTQLKLKAGTDYGFFIIPNVNPSLAKTSVIFESGPLCSLNNAPDPAASTQYMTWWLKQGPQQQWSTSRGDLSANPKVTLSGDADLSAVTSAVRTDKYNLLLRYFEAAPAPVLATALDAFAAFMVHPSTYMSVLQQIQTSAQTYWSTHKAGS
ncbi:MAG TPA: extracellular solute-binding protein [Streptosporangiaceae bacterium]